MDSLAACSFGDCLCVPEEATADILERLRKYGFRASFQARSAVG
jgi:hypothetical protein